MVDLSSSIANHINEGSLIEITVPAPRVKPGVWGGARETKHRKAGWGVLLDVPYVFDSMLDDLVMDGGAIPLMILR